MKILIAYYSKDGNTEKIAKIMAEKLNADTEKLVDTKNRSGFFGYFLAGRDATLKKRTKLEPAAKNPADYDLVILGTPIWSWNLTPAIRTYAEENKDKIKTYAFFTTSGSTDAGKMAGDFEKIMGRKAEKYTGFTSEELKNSEVYSKKLEDFIADINGGA